MQRIVKGQWCICLSVHVCALFLLAASALPAAEPFLQKTNLFAEETDGFRLYRIPGIVVTAKGSIKATMQMDVLRCKTPDMVHKEIWTHLLAYNLLRTVIAVAANENDLEPRKVSFKGAKQALTAFAPKIEAARPEDRGTLIDAMLTTIAYHRVGDRPGRWEPRARKRRSRKANRLMQPRRIAKLSQNQSRWF